MNRKLLLAGFLSVVLTGCQSPGGDKTEGSERQQFFTEAWPRLVGYSRFRILVAPNPTAPNVFIVNGKIVVDQEPVRPPGNQQGDPITIYFALEQGGNWVFPAHGIEIQNHPNFCNPVTDYVFLCKYLRPIPDMIYKYTIRVVDKSTTPPTKLKDLDPTVMN
jgi:hypothetical protein